MLYTASPNPNPSPNPNRNPNPNHYKVLYTGKAGLCAHEFILDLREFKAS